jgi:hypothetical protein
MRTSIEPTQSEIAAFDRFFKEQHPELDTTKNGQLFGEYLLVTWGVEVNETTLNAAWAQLKDQLEVLTPARVRYDQVGRQDLKAATELYNWYVGRQNILVKDGDAALENMTKLLLELRGREITPESIHEAIGRVGHRQGLHYTPTAPQRDPRRHEDDGKGFMPKEPAKPEYFGGKLNHARVPQQPAAQPERDAAPDVWETLAENLRGATHSEDAALKSINGTSWRETYTLRKKHLAQRQGSQFNRTAV